MPRSRFSDTELRRLQRHSPTDASAGTRPVWFHRCGNPLPSELNSSNFIQSALLRIGTRPNCRHDLQLESVSMRVLSAYRVFGKRERNHLNSSSGHALKRLPVWASVLIILSASGLGWWLIVKLIVWVISS